MNRFRHWEELEYIQMVKESLPAGVRQFIHCDFVTNYNPIFLGVTDYGDAEIGDGRSYHDTSHCCWPWRTRDKSTTLILQGDDIFDREGILHEMAHAIHWQLDLDRFNFIPLSGYAERNDWENFATSCQAFLSPCIKVEWDVFPDTKQLFETDPEGYYVLRRLFDYDPIQLY